MTVAIFIYKPSTLIKYKYYYGIPDYKFTFKGRFIDLFSKLDYIVKNVINSRLFDEIKLAILRSKYYREITAVTFDQEILPIVMHYILSKRYEDLYNELIDKYKDKFKSFDFAIDKTLEGLKFNIYFIGNFEIEYSSDELKDEIEMFFIKNRYSDVRLINMMTEITYEGYICTVLFNIRDEFYVVRCERRERSGQIYIFDFHKIEDKSVLEKEINKSKDLADLLRMI